MAWPSTCRARGSSPSQGGTSHGLRSASCHAAGPSWGKCSILTAWWNCRRRTFRAKSYTFRTLRRRTREWWRWGRTTDSSRSFRGHGTRGGSRCCDLAWSRSRMCTVGVGCELCSRRWRDQFQARFLPVIFTKQTISKWLQFENRLTTADQHAFQMPGNL